MFITRKHLPRRTFLKATGATLALPLLEAMVPASTALAQTSARPPQRFMGIFFPHGMSPGYWVPPGGAGILGGLPPILEPLADVRSHTVVLSGLWSKSAEPPEGTTGSDHWVAAAFLTAIKPKKTAGSDASVGSPTIDQVIAREIGQDTLLPSLQLAVEDPGSSSSNCGEGYSCAYTNSISWPAPTTPLPMEINPQVVFERLFGSGATPEQREERMRQSRSILDSLTDELARVRSRVGPADRSTLDQYTSEVREIERRIELAAQASTTAPESGAPPGVPDSYDEHMKLQLDLTALAFQADVTRVATLLGARDLTAKSYPESGADGGFHGLSHHAESPRVILEFSKINRYHVSMLGYFAEKLRATPEGDGTLLDHSLTLYGSNMGNSNQHQHFDVPHVLVGGAGGQLRGGRHLAYETRTVTSGNLLLRVMDLYGIHRDVQGDSTGRLEEL
jgi:hypothetical protein